MSDPRVDLMIGWDDLRSPASNLKPGATDPTFDSTYGWLTFAHNANEEVFTQVQLPHAWKQGSALRPHVHWMKSTSAAGEVEWELSYRWSSIGSVMDASWTVLTVKTPSISDGNTQYKHAISPFSEINAVGRKVSDMLIVKLRRKGTAYSGSNHYTNSAILLEFDIHYQIDSFGSNYEYLKARR